MLLSTSTAEHHGVWAFQSGKSEASDVISHSNLATSLKENTCNCHVRTSGDQGQTTPPATDAPTSAQPPKRPSACQHHAWPSPGQRRCSLLSNPEVRRARSFLPLPISEHSLVGERGEWQGNLGSADMVRPRKNEISMWKKIPGTSTCQIKKLL